VSELPEPLRRLAAWVEEARAAGVRNADAMTVATASPDGVPSARMVLMRGLDERGLVFFTSFGSVKGRELAVNPRAAAVFYWEPLSRQVRVTGTVGRVAPEESAAYFSTRPWGHRVSAWASAQSEPVASREALDALFEEAERRFAGVEDVPVPPFWGGFRIAPAVVELWESRENRRHDREQWSLGEHGWTSRRLQP
jgi:pyridoxamine 5'-phosphate oxidase